jgi:phosphoglycolate phosphatase
MSMNVRVDDSPAPAGRPAPPWCRLPRRKDSENMALTVVFDLDGTLVDTAPDLSNALNSVFAREQVPPVPEEQARTMIGGGARRMIESGLKLAGRTAAPADLDRMFGDFIAHYCAHIADRSRPFPGLEPALDRLIEDGCRLAVCTNKLERLSRRLLDQLGLGARFAAICGQDTFGIQKPDPAMLVRTIAAAGGSRERAVMVGDSATDIAAARGAGVPIVAVDFGYSDTPVAELLPDRLISHFRELPDAVRAVMGVRT